MMREAVIDLAAISDNVRTLRAVAGVPAMVIVKADGYGHGAVPSARAAIAGGAEWLGVADIDEALQLRRADVREPILAWLHDSDADFGPAIDNQIDIGVNYLEQLERVASAGRNARVQLKVDTGLGRNGAAETDWERLFAAARAYEKAGRIRVRGLWSHLANTEHDALQIATFARAVEAAQGAGLEPELLHLAATAGALHRPDARFTMVRIGIGAYGLSPDDTDVPGLRPAMRLAATVASVKRVGPEHGVSYGFDYTTTADTTLALIPLGYADGIPRAASGVGEVLIAGARYHVAGRIAMDQFVVDVADAPVSVGDPVTVFGAGNEGEPTAEDWARAANTINYEIVTRIGARVPRRYLT